MKSWVSEAYRRQRHEQRTGRLLRRVHNEHLLRLSDGGLSDAREAALADLDDVRLQPADHFPLEVGHRYLAVLEADERLGLVFEVDSDGRGFGDLEGLDAELLQLLAALQRHDVDDSFVLLREAFEDFLSERGLPLPRPAGRRL